MANSVETLDSSPQIQDIDRQISFVNSRRIFYERMMLGSMLPMIITSSVEFAKLYSGVQKEMDAASFMAVAGTIGISLVAMTYSAIRNMQLNRESTGLGIEKNSLLFEAADARILQTTQMLKGESSEPNMEDISRIAQAAKRTALEAGVILRRVNRRLLEDQLENPGSH